MVAAAASNSLIRSATIACLLALSANMISDWNELALDAISWRNHACDSP
jgi:hypothetical protein